MSTNGRKQAGHPSPRTSPKAGVSPRETRHLVPEQGKGKELSHWSPERIVIDRWHRQDNISIVEIEWIDAISLGDDWTEDSDLDTNPAPSLSVGYLIAETPLAVTISALVNTDFFGNGITIPRGCIVQIRYLS